MIPLPRNTVYVESTPAELNSLASALSKWTPTIPLSMVELELASLSWHLLFSNSCSMYFKAKRRMNSLTDLARRSEIMKSHFGWFELICENRLHFISPGSRKSSESISTHNDFIHKVLVCVELVVDDTRTMRRDSMNEIRSLSAGVEVKSCLLAILWSLTACLQSAFTAPTRVVWMKIFGKVLGMTSFELLELFESFDRSFSVQLSVSLSASVAAGMAAGANLLSRDTAVDSGTGSGGAGKQVRYKDLSSFRNSRISPLGIGIGGEVGVGVGGGSLDAVWETMSNKSNGSDVCMSPSCKTTGSGGSGSSSRRRLGSADSVSSSAPHATLSSSSSSISSTLLNVFSVVSRGISRLGFWSDTTVTYTSSSSSSSSKGRVRTASQIKVQPMSS